VSQANAMSMPRTAPDRLRALFYAAERRAMAHALPPLCASAQRNAARHRRNSLQRRKARSAARIPHRLLR